ncbi:hypothetical protein OAQ99_03590 [Candidatus Kapabacteria bacterium]|nr:hypothetical protein [Candidatus Kapabacteria bacterium]
MMKKLLILIAVVSSVGLFAQTGSTDDVEKTLQKFKNYRFGNVYIYKVRDASTIGEIIKANDPSNQNQASSEDFEAAKSKYDPGAIRIVEQGVGSEKLKSDITNDLLAQGYDVIPEDDMNIIYQYYLAQIIGGTDDKITTAFIITLPPSEPGRYPEEIIGMVVKQTSFDEQTDDLIENLEEVTVDEAFSYREMKLTEIDTSKVKLGASITNLYELAEVYFQQDNVQNKTLEARALGDPNIIWLDQEKGVSEPLISYNAPYYVSDYDIQLFKRISNGEPESYYKKNMEVFVGPDKISWKKYPKAYLYNRKGEIELDSLGNPMLDEFVPTNEDLPEIGVELKYGVESINVPSFSSERLSLNLIWKSLKFGLILPTGGWSSISEDIYNQQRNLTYGGFGFNFSADFDVPVINRSDVFHIDGAYVSSDAEPADFLGTDYDNNIDSWTSGNINDFQFNQFMTNPGNQSYFIRANAAAHYTFGMSIDKDNLLRFSLGGAYYNVENWSYSTSVLEDGVTRKEIFGQNGDESIGGISIKMDFMSSAGDLPWGASLQYFNESFYSNIFAQFAIIDNTLFAKINAVGRFDIKSERDPWESTGFFQPMFNLIYIF